METKQEFFEFERQTRKVFDEYYKERDFGVKRIIGEANKDFDCEVNLGGKWYKVEEKYRSHDYNDCLVETMQDTETQAPGWLYYTKADYIMYGVANKIYCIDLPGLKKFITKNKDNLNKKISSKGWGRTENVVIDWYTLKANKIAKQLR